MNSRFVMVAAAVAVAVALALGGAAWAIAGGGDDDGSSVTGPAANKASTAAVAHLGGGTANEVERENGQRAVWEVEVTKTDGSTVDVTLDANYRVVDVEGDSENEDESGVDDD